MSTRGWENALPSDLKRRPEAATMAQEPRSKYHARKTVVDGITFDSAKEAHRYEHLKMMEKGGHIARLRLQQRFELCSPMTNMRADVVEGDNRLMVIGHYVADFSYDELSAEATRWIVEDVKGFKTPLYRWKKKHFEAQYGIQIREV